jgi:methylthioribose-1-phosphate isomerase
LSVAGMPPASPLIARTVSLSIVAKDFDASRASLDAILARHNGYAAALNVATPQDAARTLQASLRIPAPQLAAALSELKALGRVEVETQNGEEVTQEHADLVARLKNSRETEHRLQDVLRNRTGRVKDVLEVEQEIARVRGEIEQMEAAQQTLEHRVDFSTIDLKLGEEYQAQLSSPAPSVLTQLRNASVNGFRSAFLTLLAVVLFAVESGPAILVWLALLFFPAWLLWRRYRRTLALGSSLNA